MGMSATLTCVSSGSIGNSYILSVDGEKLILELGIRWKDILKSLNFNLESVRACLVSPAHR